MLHVRSMLFLAAIAFFAASGTGPRAATAEEPEVDFCREVWPVLKEKCLRCHNAKKKDGALDLSTRATMLAGGHSGPALMPGNVEKSLMLELIEFDEMPPRKEKPRVTKEEFAKLRAWIAAGAPGPPEEQDASGE